MPLGPGTHREPGKAQQWKKETMMPSRTGGRFFLKPSIAVFIIPVTVLMSLSAVEAHIRRFLTSVGLKNYKLDDHMA